MSFLDLNGLSCLILHIQKWDNDILLKAYPVGSIYMSVSDVSPEMLFGGTWEQIKDTFLLACGDSHEAGSTGGEETHVLTTDEMPSHRHAMKTDIENEPWNVEWPEWTEYTTGYTQEAGITEAPATHTTYEGGSQPHNNMPPYMAVFVWKRVG